MSWWQTLSDGARRASEASGALGSQAVAAWQSSSEYVNAAARDLGQRSADATVALREAALQRQREIEAEEERLGRNAFGARAEEGVAPWEDPTLPGDCRDPVRERVLALSESEQAVRTPPPADAEFSIDIGAEAPNALRMLDEDPRLAALRFKLVPSAMKDDEFWKNYFYRVHMVRSSFPVEDTEDAEDAPGAGGAALPPAAGGHSPGGAGAPPGARESATRHSEGELGGKGQQVGASPRSGEEGSFVRVARPAAPPPAAGRAEKGAEGVDAGEEEDLALAFASDEAEAEMEGQTSSAAHAVPEHALLHMRGQLGLGASGGAGKGESAAAVGSEDVDAVAATGEGGGEGEGEGGDVDVDQELELDWELEGLDSYEGADGEGEVGDDEHAELEAAISAELGE